MRSAKYDNSQFFMKYYKTTFDLPQPLTPSPKRRRGILSSSPFRRGLR